MPDEENLPVNVGGSDNFPNIPVNDLGQLTATPSDPFPNIPINDIAQKSLDGGGGHDRFPKYKC